MATSPPPWLSVVISIKDERDNLTPLTERLLKVLEAQPASRTASFEIVYVDDGSTDGSGPLLDDLTRRYPAVQALHFDRHYGQSAGFAAGFRHATGTLIATMDGDLQNDPADLAVLVPLTATYDLVCGRRMNRHDGLVRRVSSRIAYVVRTAVTHDGVHDTGCSLKVFRRTVIDRIPQFDGMHRFFPALALMHGFTVTEVPVRHHPRVHGQSKYGIRNRLFRGLYDLMAIRWMMRRALRYRLQSEDVRREP